MSQDTIVICGAGIAGLAAAVGLFKKGFRVSLLGPQVALPPARDDAYHPRVYAISQASQQFLAQLGAWRLMDARRVTAVESMQVFGDASGEVNLHAWQAAQPALAWIVESGELERALRQVADVLGVPWHGEALRSLEPGAVVAESGKRLAADLVVGADGASSAVRAAAGISHHSSPYGDTGVVTHLDAELPHQGAAMQWFMGDSVLALLPMPDTAAGAQVSMVWSMPAGKAETLLALPAQEQAQWLEARLAHATQGALGSLKVRSPVFGFPLFLEHSDMIAPGVALVSDAAHRVHPLAGQGLNLGLGDVQALVEVLAQKEAFRRAGDLAVLRRYRRRRAEPLLAMRLATDGLHRLFSVQVPPIVWARNAGMALVDRAPLLKQLLIAGAAGRQ